MLRAAKLSTSVALSMVLALCVVLFSGASSTMPRKARAAPARPNFVFILTDDMRKDDLRFMPQTRSLLGDQGMTFSNALVSDPLCTPSRASILRGQYPHNTHVFANETANGGGWDTFHQADEQDTMGTRMQDAGYRTGFFGKYMNGYNTTYVPPGWDDWFAHAGEPQYYDYDINDNGTLIHYGTDPADYEADVLANRAEAFIGDSASAGAPFLAYVAPKAPHTPSTPAPRDEHAYDGLTAPHPPSYNEEDVGDKPPWIRALPPLDATDEQRINGRYELRAESLQAVDDLVAGIVDRLRADGELSNTYIFFTSDNGWHLGEHRVPHGKARPYEEDVRMPLLVRGPGVAPGSTTGELALNTDYLPTLTDLAGAPPPPYADGRSLGPVLHGTATAWRSAALIEGAHYPQASYSPDYRAVRTGGLEYTEYAGGERELYDLSTDPHELANLYDPSNPPADLPGRLQALEGCSGGGCVMAEDGQLKVGREGTQFTRGFFLRAVRAYRGRLLHDQSGCATTTTTNLALLLMRQNDTTTRSPPGYVLDLLGDACVIVLRRADGTVAARFTKHVDPEQIRRAAAEDYGGSAGERRRVP